MLGATAQRVKDALMWVPLAGQSSNVDSLTLWPVAGLSVAALHCGGHQVAVALMHGVQVPLSVRADHLSISRARSTAPRTLPGTDTTLILRENQPQQQANILMSSPGPSLPHATSCV